MSCSTNCVLGLQKSHLERFNCLKLNKTHTKSDASSLYSLYTYAHDRALFPTPPLLFASTPRTTFFPDSANMSLTVETVEKLFEPLIAGDSMKFFTFCVDDEVIWTIGNPENKTCPLSGRYVGKHPTAIALSQLAPHFSPDVR